MKNNISSLKSRSILDQLGFNVFPVVGLGLESMLGSVKLLLKQRVRTLELGLVVTV